MSNYFEKTKKLMSFKLPRKQEEINVCFAPSSPPSIISPHFCLTRKKYFSAPPKLARGSGAVEISFQLFNRPAINSHRLDEMSSR